MARLRSVSAVCEDAVHLASGEQLLRESAPGRGLAHRAARVELHVADLVGKGEEALDRGQLSGDGRRGQVRARLRDAAGKPERPRA